mmetsp:Transcript_20377/g.59546  ORF Transcript_20377/g.59546 Transcript_20377/m.59546 type:complete len:206 (+) Transcript_20377:1520-2137(+)
MLSTSRWMSSSAQGTLSASTRQRAVWTRCLATSRAHASTMFCLLASSSPPRSASSSSTRPEAYPPSSLRILPIPRHPRTFHRRPGRRTRAPSPPLALLDLPDGAFQRTRPPGMVVAAGHLPGRAGEPKKRPGLPRAGLSLELNLECRDGVPYSSRGAHMKTPVPSTFSTPNSRHPAEDPTAMARHPFKTSPYPEELEERCPRRLA